MIGKSPSFLLALERARKVAQHPISVLIQGETGTGKEEFARLIHDLSRRGKFVPVNCANLQGPMMESILFGHEHGAFTGAVKSHRGCWREAEGGTLFLDEIGELPFELQAKLLRALQTRKIQPLGSDKEITTNVRVVAATHQPIKQWVAEGRFRRDLYARLSEYELTLPALRERGEDVLLMAEHLISTSPVCKTANLVLTPEVKKAMVTLTWPENIRGIERWLNRLVIDGVEVVRLEHLPEDEAADIPRSKATEKRSVASNGPEPEVILGTLRQLGRASRTELEAELQLPPRSLQRALHRLVHEGRILQEGATNRLTYRPAA